MERDLPDRLGLWQTCCGCTSSMPKCMKLPCQLTWFVGAVHQVLGWQWTAQTAVDQEWPGQVAGDTLDALQVHPALRFADVPSCQTHLSL